MKCYYQYILNILVGASLASQLIAQDCFTVGDGKVAYVQGGACKPGKGTKKSPYTTLAEAQADSSWDTLVVLSSTVPLDGGITLRSGTKLIGDVDPTKRIPCPELPIITNSSHTLNDGNGVVVLGNAVIENIYFKNTFGSGVNYSQGSNVTIENVLVTGHNNGNPDSVLGGIEGRCPNSGKTCIRTSIVRNPNNLLARGVVERSLQSANRELLISCCEIADIPGTHGMLLSIDGTNASSAVIESTSVHDCAGTGLQSQNFGLASGTYSVEVRNSSFSNMGGNHISQLASLNAALDIYVCGCTFNQTVVTGSFQSALFAQSVNSTSTIDIKNCISNNLNIFVLGLINDLTVPSTQNITIKNNRVTNNGTFYFFQNTSVIGGQTNYSLVEGNLFTGNRGFGLALFVPNSLLIDIISKHNCFMGNSTSFAAIHGFGIINGGNNVTLTAHKNNFAGFASDLVDTIPTNATYDVTNNWWGPATVVCVTNPPDCSPFQTCIDGLCEGPNNAMVTNTTSVDASNPLTKSIKCASKCSHTCAHSPFGSNFQASSPEQQQPNYVAAAELQLAVEAQA